VKIGILGAGAYGAAIAGVLRENGHGVKFFDPIKLPSVSLSEVTEYAQVIVVAVPAEFARKQMKEFSHEALSKPALIMTKGIMDLSVWEPFSYFELVSGPGFADDIRKRKRTKLTVAATGLTDKDIIVAEKILANSYVKFDKTDDKQGVAILSGLKNLFAIEAGRRGLAGKDEEFKEYINDIYRETEKVLLYNGGFVETARLAAGIGDLVLTCGSEKSRNYQFGQLLSRLTKRGGVLRQASSTDDQDSDVDLDFRRHSSVVKQFLRTTTVEGVFAAKEIDRIGVAIPKEAEILTDILRRIKNVTKR